MGNRPSLTPPAAARVIAMALVLPLVGAVVPARVGHADDVGITSDTIRVGVFVAEVGGFADAGSEVQVDNQRQPWQVFYDDLNARGGVDGRLVDYQFVSYDPLSADSMRAACITMTEDLDVFAVTTLSSPVGVAIDCVVDEHETPMLMEQQVSEAQLESAAGRLRTLAMSVDRGIRNQVADLAAYGFLDDAVIGILQWDQHATPPPSDYVAELDELGYRECDDDATAPCYAYWVLPSGASDLAGLSATANVAVEEMQALGVDRLVLDHAIFGVAVVCAALDGHGWRPQLLAPQLTVGVLEDNPEACAPAVADGAIGTTASWHGERAAGAPLRPGAAACKQRYETLSGTTLDPYERGTGPAYGQAVATCVLFDAFVRALETAGPELTRARFVEALGATGELPDSVDFAGTWTPTKHDGSDFVRTVEFDATGCTCWTIVDETPRPTRAR